MAKKYDVIVVGAGSAGMTATLYSSRANLSVLMLDRGIYGGQMNNTSEIENYTGFSSILGPDLAKDMFNSTMRFGAEFKYGNVLKIIDNGLEKKVVTDDGEYYSNVVIIATGADHKKLNVPGESEYNGKGVSYCAVCDGAFFKNQDVAVIGGGDSAIEEGLYLTNLVNSVTVIHRRNKLKAQEILQKRAFNNKKMKFIWNAKVEQINGNGKVVTGINYLDKASLEQKTLKVNGVFIYIGLRPVNDSFLNLDISNSKGWIITDKYMRTAVKGIYAIGDIRSDSTRQIATAVGDGSIAGQQAFDYIQNLNNMY